MEFVCQLWAYKSEKFILGVPCPNFLKTHVWLLLILFKAFLVGSSIVLFSHPDLYKQSFVGSYEQRRIMNNLNVANQNAAEPTNYSLRMSSLCSDNSLASELMMYYKW